MRVFRSEARRNQAIIGTVALAAMTVAAAVLFGDRLDPALLDPDHLATVLGPYGPVGIIAGQIVQVLVMPVPPVTAVVSGILYGPWFGTLYSFIGVSIGSLLGLGLSRRYGRPVVEALVTDELMDRFDGFTEKTGYLPIILVFTLPGFPDDVLVLLVGLTTLDWKRLAVITTVTRIPGLLLLTTTGHSIGQARPALFVAAAGLTLLVCYWSVRYTDSIEDSVRGVLDRL